MWPQRGSLYVEIYNLDRTQDITEYSHHMKGSRITFETTGFLSSHLDWNQLIKTALHGGSSQQLDTPIGTFSSKMRTKASGISSPVLEFHLVKNFKAIRKNEPEEYRISLTHGLTIGVPSLRFWIWILVNILCLCCLKTGRWTQHSYWRSRAPCIIEQTKQRETRPSSI